MGSTLVSRSSRLYRMRLVQSVQGPGSSPLALTCSAAWTWGVGLWEGVWEGVCGVAGGEGGSGVGRRVGGWGGWVGVERGSGVG